MQDGRKQSEAFHTFLWHFSMFKTEFYGYYVEALREFRRRFLGKRPALFKYGQWHFHQDNTPDHNSILVADYMTIKTVHSPYSADLAPWDFWLFPKLRSCRYETIEEMKEAVTKVIDTLTQGDFHGALKKLLERYNNFIAAGGDYFAGDYSFMCVVSIKVPIRKKSGNLLKAPRIYVWLVLPYFKPCRVIVCRIMFNIYALQFSKIQKCTFSNYSFQLYSVQNVSLAVIVFIYI